MSTEELSRTRFEAALTTTFTIEALPIHGSIPVMVEARLQRITAQALTGAYEQYSLFFLAPVTPLLPQGTYRFRHAALGELLLFMVPVGQDGTGTQYEVCVSRTLN